MRSCIFSGSKQPVHQIHKEINQIKRESNEYEIYLLLWERTEVIISYIQVLFRFILSSSALQLTVSVHVYSIQGDSPNS